jgi:hypothetical protein
MSDLRTSDHPPIRQYGPPVSAGLPRDAMSNLANGLRAIFLLRARPGGWRPFADQLILFTLVDVVFTLVVSWLQVEGPGDMNWSALPRASLQLPLGLLAGWLVARRSRDPSLLPGLATVVVVLTFLLDIAGDVVLLGSLWQLWPEGFDTTRVSIGIFAWWAFACGVAAFRMARGSRIARTAYLGWTAVVLALPLWFIPYVPPWQAVETGEPGDAFAAATEEVLYSQGRLLDQLGQRIAPQRPGVQEIFFLGAAGYASENVFLNEVSLASEILRTRFDAEGHAAIIANNPGTLRTLPVATATSLGHMLKVVGRTMDTEEDVLFLFLTSHGSEDHRLAMEFWPLQLIDVDPAMLKQMLDASGIRWRVIVISACYAGGFIEPLKDSRTLVMTAADPEHSSFGCGADSDLTYFGKAYFDEALRETRSLTAAFEVARRKIADRESAQGFEPSNPQIFLGEEIAAKLRQMGLHAPAPVAAPAPAPASK